MLENSSPDSTVHEGDVAVTTLSNKFPTVAQEDSETGERQYVTDALQRQSTRGISAESCRLEKTGQVSFYILHISGTAFRPENCQVIDNAKTRWKSKHKGDERKKISPPKNAFKISIFDAVVHINCNSYWSTSFKLWDPTMRHHNFPQRFQHPSLIEILQICLGAARPVMLFDDLLAYQNHSKMPVILLRTQPS